jgi:hypothetical protein
MHEPNITRLPRTQDWRLAEGLLRDALRCMGLPLCHAIGAGGDFVVCRCNGTRFLFSLETSSSRRASG